MYAQILRATMRVNLIGGEAEGLPVEHPDVICVDIGDSTDVKLYMKYNEETGEFYEFYEETPELQPEPPTIEERLMAVEDALLMIL